MERQMKESGISWIGKIPEIWSQIRLKYLVNIETGDSDTQDADPDGEYNFYVRSPIIEHSRHYTFSGDSILMAGDGVGAGKVFHYATGKYAVHQRVYCLHDFSPAVNSQFLFLYLSNRFPVRVEQGSAKSTVDSIRLPMLKDFPVLLPSIDEQERIVEFLKEKYYAIDSLSSDIQKEIKTLETYKKSLITEAVTKGLYKSVPMKNSGVTWLGKIPSFWKVFRLKHVLRNKLSYGAAETGIDYDESLPRYIRITDIISAQELKEDGKLSLPIELGKQYQVEVGDVLFARSGATVGKTFLMIEKYAPATYAGYLIKATVNKNLLLPKFLTYYTESHAYEAWKNQIFVQATIQNIGADRYSELPVPVPSIKEQEAIIMHIDSKCSEIDSIISSKKQQLETLAAYKNSLIYEYVTGKKEVPAV